MRVTFKGQKVEIAGVSGRYQDDVMVEYAYYIETDEELNEEQYEQLHNDCAAEIQEMWFVSKIGEADYYHDND